MGKRDELIEKYADDLEDKCGMQLIDKSHVPIPITEDKSSLYLNTRFANLNGHFMCLS